MWSKIQFLTQILHFTYPIWFVFPPTIPLVYIVAKCGELCMMYNALHIVNGILYMVYYVWHILLNIIFSTSLCNTNPIVQKLGLTFQNVYLFIIFKWLATSNVQWVCIISKWLANDWPRRCPHQMPPRSISTW